MTPDDVDPILLASLDDHVFSRAERRALKERLDSADDSARAYFRFRAFEIVKEKLRDEDRALVGWLEEVVKAVAPRPFNLLIGASGLSLAEAADLGVRRISVGGSLARAGWGGFMRAAKEMAEKGTFTELASGYPGGDLNTMFS